MPFLYVLHDPDELVLVFLVLNPDSLHHFLHSELVQQAEVHCDVGQGGHCLRFFLPSEVQPQHENVGDEAFLGCVEFGDGGFVLVVHFSVDDVSAFFEVIEEAVQGFKRHLKNGGVVGFVDDAFELLDHFVHHCIQELRQLYCQGAFFVVVEQLLQLDEEEVDGLEEGLDQLREVLDVLEEVLQVVQGQVDEVSELCGVHLINDSHVNVPLRDHGLLNQVDLLEQFASFFVLAYLGEDVVPKLQAAFDDVVQLGDGFFALFPLDHEIGQVQDVLQKGLLRPQPVVQTDYQVLIVDFREQFGGEVVEDSTRLDAVADAGQVVEDSVHLVLLTVFDQGDGIPDVAAVVVESVVETEQGQAFKEHDSPFHEVGVQLFSHQAVEKGQHFLINGGLFELVPDELVLDDKNQMMQALEDELNAGNFCFFHEVAQSQQSFQDKGVVGKIDGLFHQGEHVVFNFQLARHLHFVFNSFELGRLQELGQHGLVEKSECVVDVAGEELVGVLVGGDEGEGSHEGIVQGVGGSFVLQFVVEEILVVDVDGVEFLAFEGGRQEKEDVGDVELVLFQVFVQFGQQLVDHAKHHLILCRTNGHYFFKECHHYSFELPQVMKSHLTQYAG